MLIFQKIPSPGRRKKSEINQKIWSELHLQNLVKSHNKIKKNQETRKNLFLKTFREWPPSRVSNLTKLGAGWKLFRHRSRCTFRLWNSVQFFPTVILASRRYKKSHKFSLNSETKNRWKLDTRIPTFRAINRPVS